MLSITTSSEEAEQTKGWKSRLGLSEKDWSGFGAEPEDKLLALKSLGIDLEEVLPPQGSREGIPELPKYIRTKEAYEVYRIGRPEFNRIDFDCDHCREETDRGR